MPNPIDWDNVPERTLFPGFHGRFAHTERMTFVLWRIEAGATLPLHSHPHEQVVHTYSGELELTVDGQRLLLTPGTVLAIPPDAKHEGVARTECRVMDAFAPVREDYRGFVQPPPFVEASDYATRSSSRVRPSSSPAK